MDLKNSVFLFFLVIISIFPLFFSVNKNRENNEIIKELPDFRVINGNLKEYNPYLEKKAFFSKIERFDSNDIYKFDKITFFEKDKDFWNKIVTDKAELKNGVAVSKRRTFFYGKEYNVSADSTKYLLNKKVLSGENFELVGNSFYGKGSYFVYQNGIINAKNIDYIIKDKND